MEKPVSNYGFSFSQMIRPFALSHSVVVMSSTYHTGGGGSGEGCGVQAGSNVNEARAVMYFMSVLYVSRGYFQQFSLSLRKFY